MKKEFKPFRSYDCKYHYLVEGKLQSCKNNACWAELSGKPVGDIYIDEYEGYVSEEHKNVLIETINKITPFKEVMVQGKKLLEYRLLKTYDQNLVLLNFVRLLWHSPYANEVTGKSSATTRSEYSTMLFQELLNLQKMDPLEALTSANKKVLEALGSVRSVGHSNVHQHSILKVKNTKELLDYLGTSTYQFLTN